MFLTSLSILLLVSPLRLLVGVMPPSGLRWLLLAALVLVGHVRADEAHSKSSHVKTLNDAEWEEAKGWLPDRLLCPCITHTLERSNAHVMGFVGFRFGEVDAGRVDRELLCAVVWPMQTAGPGLGAGGAEYVCACVLGSLALRI